MWSLPCEKEHHNSHIGKILEGLVEVHKDNSLTVFTSNYIPVIVDSKLESNEVVRVKIVSVDDESRVYGILV